MNSPPASPSRFELGGASRVTGGIFRGQAYGNVFNHADAEVMFESEPRMGKIHIYRTHVDPTLTKPDMVLKHKVTSKLKPILKSLARQYSPVCSKSFIFFWIIFKLSFVCRWQSPCFRTWRWYVDSQGKVWSCIRRWWWCELDIWEWEWCVAILAGKFSLVCFLNLV